MTRRKTRSQSRPKQNMNSRKSGMSNRGNNSNPQDRQKNTNAYSQGGNTRRTYAEMHAFSGKEGITPHDRSIRTINSRGKKDSRILKMGIL
ncbi:hypothetical protein SNE40_013145 [Patella caerulea]|uniref:Uncharacterized protein n=1 Tax=Patella caerulea TaxID=87958 RepID=A0AAN8PGM1_PATCE